MKQSNHNEDFKCARYLCISQLLRVEVHFERNYQELWRNHEETKRPNDGVVYDVFLFIRERMKLTQTSHQTSHQR